jgi:hypothetical protein
LVAAAGPECNFGPARREHQRPPGEYLSAMADAKLTPLQAQRIEQIQGFLKTLAHVKKLVGELESNRAARQQVLQALGAQISRELSRMRVRAVSASIGTVADLAGHLSIAATRSVGLQMKLRTLNDGIASLGFQLDRALALAMAPEPKRPTGTQAAPGE